MSLIDELKRRNVFRVGVAYAVVGWVVLEVASIIAPALGLPDWSITLLLFIGVGGLPFALLFAWAFELTPEGLKRTEDVTPDSSITGETGTKLNGIIIALLSIALLLVLAERFFIFEPPDEATDGDVVAEAKGPQSIAVLPFVNMSDDRANEHFGDGLAEELLNLLAKVPDLHVAARTSTFYFKDKDATIADVAKALDVGTVLEGSVRRSGDTIRVVAQLISAEDESHLWSEKYDRPMTDVFAVQDDIARQIVQALMPHLDVAANLPTTSDSGIISPEMYERFLLARHSYYEGKLESRTAAHNEFLVITRAAPGYSPAWSWLARTWLALPNTSSEVAYAGAREAIDNALRLNPQDSNAYLALARLSRSQGDEEASLANLDKALALDPRNVDALILRQYVLVNLQRIDEAIDSLQQARALDPLHPDVLVSLAHLLNLQGQHREAFGYLDSLYRVNPVRATSQEYHYYGDSNEIARMIYIGEQDNNRADPHISSEYFAWILLENGFFDHPVVQASTMKPIALANLHDRLGAENALASTLAGMNDPTERLEIQALTYFALGDYQKVSDLLWERWQKLGTDRFSDDFWEREAIYLCAAARQTGESDRCDAVLPQLRKWMKSWSSTHAGGYRQFMALYYLIEKREDEALAMLQAAADDGYPGEYKDGGPVWFNFFVPNTEAFNAVRTQIRANRDAQLLELERLRASGMSIDEARREYLREL
jgi:TolB-like protein